MALALRLQEFRRAGAIGAEMKIETDRRAANSETLHQYLLDEIFRGEFGQGSTESKHDCAVKAGGGEEPQFGGFIGEPEQRLIRVEECPRMRLEGECGSRFAERERARKRRRDHRFMPRCTPSKLPMATAAPRNASAGAQSRTTLKVFAGIGLTKPVRALRRAA